MKSSSLVNRLLSQSKQTILCLGFSLSSIPLIVCSVNAAETISLNYGPLEFSLSVESLEVYAEEGEIRSDLADYLNFVDNFLTPQQLNALREQLKTPAPVSTLTLATLLYSPQGEAILERVGRLIQTQTRQPGFFAIRSALILSAADEQEGLTPLNILKKFPSPEIRLNSEQGFEVFNQLNDAIFQTERATQSIEQQFSQEISNEPVDLSQLPNPVPVGEVVEPIELPLYDSLRNRSIPVDLYLPSTSEDLAPLIIISHGLGSDRTTFKYLAQHLVSSGFAVVVPEHPGSNAEQIQALFEGRAQEVTSPRELVDRPWDIKYVLDQLEKQYGDRLNVKQVGIVGQSFGGYTALALAGAKLNFEQLEQYCQGSDFLNLSFLIQCQGKDILRVSYYELADERISAVIAINPLTSLIFGQEQVSQIQVPTMIIAGSADLITPALDEQIIPFTWLKISQKYLVFLKGGTHFSTLDESSGSFPIPERFIGPTPKIAQQYLKTLGLAFFQTYINQDLTYQPYLSATYAQQISETQNSNIREDEQKMPLRLIQSLTPQQLKRE